MAVIVKINEKGEFEYGSIKGLELSEAEQKKALDLNNRIKKEMLKLSRLVKHAKNKLRNKVELYWNFGYILRRIFDEESVNPAEKKLFWINVWLHAPKELLAKDRGPNRIHMAYCFRLAWYPKNIALKRKWSEWVYLFDSPFINGESRFDEWDKAKMEKEKSYVLRKNTRLFIQCLNSILGNKATKDLSDNELLRCYDVAWQLTKNLVKHKKLQVADLKDKLKKIIHQKNNLIGGVMDGEIDVDRFAQEIIKEI